MHLSFSVNCACKCSLSCGILQFNAAFRCIYALKRATQPRLIRPWGPFGCPSCLRLSLQRAPVMPGKDPYESPVTGASLLPPPLFFSPTTTTISKRIWTAAEDVLQDPYPGCPPYPQPEWRTRYAWGSGLTADPTMMSSHMTWSQCVQALCFLIPTALV